MAQVQSSIPNVVTSSQPSKIQNGPIFSSPLVLINDVLRIHDGYCDTMKRIGHLCQS
jgi:hypothetical protein